MTQKRLREIVAALHDEELSVADRNLLTTALLDRLGAIPTRARILVEKDGAGNVLGLQVDGKPIHLALARKLRISARSLYRNFAYKFVRETVDWLAIKQGVHYNTSPEQGLFAKAILWQHNEELELIALLAQDGFDE